MVKILEPETIFRFIVNDFECAWDSLASNPSATGRGNFLFGLQAMLLLEWACRLCSNSPSALDRFSNALNTIEPKYFTSLPGPCNKPAGFALPHLRDRPSETPLLWALYDLVRNGQAHEYQQIVVRLIGDKRFYVALSGPVFGFRLQEIEKKRPEHHLAFARDRDGDLRLWLCPAVLFLDIKTAIQNVGLLDLGLKFEHLGRPGTRGGLYLFRLEDLEKSLGANGCTKLPEASLNRFF